MSLDVYLEKPKCSTCGHVGLVYEANITHNLGPMAKEAGIYAALWRPEEVGITTARQVAEACRPGLADLRARPEHYRTFDAVNGWGRYENLVEWADRYIAACDENGDAIVRVWR